MAFSETFSHSNAAEPASPAPAPATQAETPLPTGSEELLFHPALQKANLLVNTNEPARFFPAVSAITDISQQGLTVTFTLKLLRYQVYQCENNWNLTNTPGGFETGVERSNNLKLLGENCDSVFHVAVKSKGEDKQPSRELPVRVLTFFPPSLGTNDEVKVTAELESAPPSDGNVVLAANTRVGEIATHIIERNTNWLTKIAIELTNRVATLPDAEAKKSVAILQNVLKTGLGGDGHRLPMTEWRPMLNNALHHVDYTNNTASPAILTKYREPDCERHDPKNDATTVHLFQEYAKLSGEWNNLNTKSNVTRATNLVVLVAHRLESLRISLDRRKGVEILESEGGKIAEFKWKHILGFTNFIEKIQQVPHKDVEVNLGKGIADHFIVLELHFQNRTTNKVLIYGDGIEIPCVTRSYGYTNAYSYRRLLEVNPIRINYVPGENSPPPVAKAPATTPKKTKAAKAVGIPEDPIEKKTKKEIEKLDRSIGKTSKELDELEAEQLRLAQKKTQAENKKQSTAGIDKQREETDNKIKEKKNSICEFEKTRGELIKNLQLVQAAPIEPAANNVPDSPQTATATTARKEGVWAARNPRRIFGEGAHGMVETNRIPLMVRPIPLSFMRSGHQRREMNTTRAKSFRAAQFVGGVAAAIIPVVGAGKAFSESTALYGDVLIPSARTLLGDTSEVQRQTFENESLDQYLELEVGQSCHKLIYLPRNGVDQIRPGHVLFIDGVATKAQDISIRAALIKADL